MRRRVNALGRTAAVVAALLVAGGALVWAGPRTARPGSEGWAELPPDAQVAALAAAAAWLVLAWLLLAGQLSAAAALPGKLGRIADAAAKRVAPIAVRRVVEAALGIVVTAGLVAPSAALASPGRRGPAVHRGSTSTATAPAGLQLGDRVYSVDVRVPSLPEPEIAFDRPASGSSRVAPAPMPALHIVQGALRQDERAADDAVVVTVGESLWSIAARELGAAATDQQVDARWREWYAANHAVIGADPDLITPGTRLTAPAADADR